MKVIKINFTPKLNSAISLLLAASGCCALFIFLWSTPLGVGVGPDSALYFDAARHILAGNGFQTIGGPLTITPPMYPLLLAMGGLTGADPWESAKWIHAFLYVLNVLLVGLMTYLVTNKSVKASLCSVLFFLSSVQLFRIHIVVWSEPSFILFFLSAFLLLTLHIVRPRFILFLGASIFAGLALTTRYVGLTLLPPMMLAILLFEKVPIKTRIRDSSILLVIGIFPLAIWVIRNVVVAHNAVGRTLGFHPVNISHLKKLINTATEFWFPFNCRHCFEIPQILSLLAVGLVLAGYFSLLRAELRTKVKASVSTIMQTLTVSFFITYVLFLIITISFAAASTLLDSRTMSPVFVLGVVFLISVVWSVSRHSLRPGLWRDFLAFFFVFIYVRAGPALSAASRERYWGNGYTGRSWYQSESMAYVRSLPKGAIIYSNVPDAIHFLTGRTAVYYIPRKTRPDHLSTNSHFESELKAMQNEMSQKGAVIVYFDYVTWRWYLPSKEEMEEKYKIPVVLRLGDGTVYAVSKH